MNIRERVIRIEGLLITCSIGIHAHEQEKPQRVLIDAELHMKPGTSPRPDSIDAVLDYDFFPTLVRSLVASRHFNLQETLCEAIAERCLEQSQIEAVRVITRKPDAYADCDAVGYEVFCSR